MCPCACVSPVSTAIRNAPLLVAVVIFIFVLVLLLLLLLCKTTLHFLFAAHRLCRQIKSNTAAYATAHSLCGIADSCLLWPVERNSSRSWVRHVETLRGQWENTRNMAREKADCPRQKTQPPLLSLIPWVLRAFFQQSASKSVLSR